MKYLLPFLALAIAGTVAPANAAILYDAALGTTLNQQGWLYLTDPRHATLADFEGLGTIIDDDSPVPLMAMRAGSGSLTISWGASNGWLYTLQSATSLLPPVAWSNCAPYVDLPGSGITHSVSAAPGPEPVRFFRVRATETSP